MCSHVDASAHAPWTSTIVGFGDLYTVALADANVVGSVTATTASAAVAMSARVRRFVRCLIWNTVSPLTVRVPRGDGLERVAAQPGEHVVGDVTPAVVDGQRVRPVGELRDVGDRVGVPVLLEGGPGDGLGYGVVLAPRDEEQRPA